MLAESKVLWNQGSGRSVCLGCKKEKGLKQVDTTITVRRVGELKGKYISEDGRIMQKLASSPPELLKIVESMRITEEQRNSTLPFEFIQLIERGLKEDIDSICDL